MDYIKQNVAITLIGAVVFVASGVGAYMVLQKNDSSNKTADVSLGVKDNTASLEKRDSNEACDVFSPDAIASAFGGVYLEGEPGYASDLPQSIVNPGMKNENLKNYSCMFEQENDGTPAGKAAAFGLSVTLNNFSNATDAQKYLDAYIEMLEKSDGLTKVSDTGDQAFFASSESGEEAIAGIEMFYARKDKKVYVLAAGSENPIDRPDVRRRIIALAKEI